MKKIFTIIFLFLLTPVLFTPLLCPKVAFALSAGEIKALSSYLGKSSFVESATRYLKPLSEVAENITVITEQDMIDMNAHTVAEALERVPGLSMEMRHVFANMSVARIQGSDVRQVKVIIDGITLNFFNSGSYGLGDIPVQHILRIEIIKGPASSAWGSSLGGVINIITKSGWGMGRASGNLYASYGERDTEDFRADIAGELGDFQYYLYAGKLHSDGFHTGEAYREEHFYTKLRYNLTPQLAIGFTSGYNNKRGGMGKVFELIMDRNYRPLFTTLLLKYSFDKKSELSLEMRYLRQRYKDNFYDTSTGNFRYKFDNKDKTRGATLKLLKNYSSHTLLLGVEYDREKHKSNSAVYDTKKQERWALFTNDTFKLMNDSISITPSMRFEKTGRDDEVWAPALGVTLDTKKELLLRLSIARGFNSPTLSQTYASSYFGLANPDLKPEKVWSYQAGAETRLFDSVWLKLTLFRHDVRNGIQWVRDNLNSSAYHVSHEKQRRQGAEIEMRTIPVWNTSLHTAFTYVDAEERTKGEGIPEAGGYSIYTGLKYSDGSLSALLKGYYIWWDDTRSFYDGKYDDMIFDITVKKNVYRDADKERKVEIFLKGHNIFNGSQYLRVFFKNQPRWVEMGVRCSF